MDLVDADNAQTTQNLGDRAGNRQWLSPLLYCVATLGR